ncbi:MAG: homoserine kinase [Phototrophicales bacterium]
MTTFNSAEAYAPASMGNVGVGFDILGLAFCEPGDIVHVERLDGTDIVIESIEGDGGVLPRDAAKNTASVAVKAFLKMIDASSGVSISLKKGLPLSSGLGSSAASAVAAVVAANALFGEPLTCEALLPACLEGEALVSGYHADNVGPSLLGGITLITGTSIQDIYRLPVPENMHFALITPNIAVPTVEARAVLPQMISLKQMVSQTGAVARLIDALYRNDLQAVVQAMESDEVVEPARAMLMPLLNEARTLAKQKGALGLVISGAGPTLCAVCDSSKTAVHVADALQGLYDEAKIGGVARVTKVDQTGARVLNVL